MSSSDSEEDVPLAVLAERKQAAQAANGKPSPQPRKKPAPAKKKRVSSEDESGDASSGSEDTGSEGQQRSRRAKASRSPAAKRPRRSGSAGPGGKSKKDGAVMWTSLKHCGVLFPPEYVPHGVKMLYDGQPVDLTVEQEEVATMYAVMIETDYMNKPLFKKNFWAGFKEVLGKGHKIQSLDKCDFRPIYEHLMADRERKKNLPKEVRQLRAGGWVSVVCKLMRAACVLLQTAAGSIQAPCTWIVLGHMFVTNARRRKSD
jgi:DNA topoisomerase-1